MSILRLLIASLALLIAGAGFEPAAAEKRVALVIGNSAYSRTPALPNPRNDAADLTAALKDLDFEVISAVDAGLIDMNRALARFQRAARGADVALFFYAGHGLQYRGGNYLMPVDAKLEDDVDITYEMVKVDDVLTALSEAAGVKMLILDACRNNPLAEQIQSRNASRSLGQMRGFSRMERVQGTLIAYATQPHQVAADGVGRNSPFTAALLKEIGTPNLEVVSLFRNVALEVHRSTEGKQQPELSVSILGQFFFKRSETDIETWGKIRGSDRRADFLSFLERFPKSVLAEDARARIASIDKAEAERLGGDAIAKERLAREAIERERLAKEIAERERLAKEIAEKEKLAKEAIEKERLAALAAERERLAKEIAERERLAKEAAERLKALAPPPVAVVPPPPAAPAEPPTTTTTTGVGPVASLDPRNLAPVAPPAPPPTPPLAGTALVVEVKKELKRIGCYAGDLGGTWPTTAGVRALADFAKHAALTPVPKEPTSELLATLRGKADRVCPVVFCGAGTVEKEGICVAVARPEPVKPKPEVAPAPRKKVERPAPTPARQRAERPAPRKPTGGGGGRCFTFNGQRFCE